jgi:hypothetical protein
VVQSCADGAVVVELSFAGLDWLVREILKEAGDAAVLEPEDARQAVRAAAAGLSESYAAPPAGSAGARAGKQGRSATRRKRPAKVARRKSSGDTGAVASRS